MKTKRLLFFYLSLMALLIIFALISPKTFTSTI
jgi:hypothetical protein